MSTSQNPQSVKIARKRGAEEPPSTLIVQPQDQAAAPHARPVVYVRQQSNPHKRRDISKRTLGQTSAGGKGGEDAEGEAAFAPELKQRTFNLKVTGKRRRDEVATFVERKRERSRSPGAGKVDDREVAQFAAQERRYKRPSKQPRRARKEEGDAEAVRLPTETEQREMEMLGRYLHEATLEEMERERLAKMAKVAAPKISGQKARELHRKRMERNREIASRAQRNGSGGGGGGGGDGDVDMGDGDYIYDTYVLAPQDVHGDTSASTSTSSITDFDAMAPHASDIGYLIISPEDQDTWQTYIDDLPLSDDDAAAARSDDEDENAEDYYGADYPEDELSSDDEFGKGAYGYRGRGGEESDGDAYQSSDDDEAAWSDGEDEVERMMNPFKYRGVPAGGVGRSASGVFR